MPIRRHAFWHVADDIDSLRRSKRLAASISRFWAPHRVNQVAIPIDGSIEITPFSLDVDLGFIHIPGSSCLPSSFCPQLVCHERGKARLRVSDCLMRELEAKSSSEF